MPHIILNPYYFSTNLFQFLINFNMIIVLTKCIYKFLFNGNKTRCTTLICHYMKYYIKTKGPIISKMLYDIWHKIFVIYAKHHVILSIIERPLFVINISWIIYLSFTTIHAIEPHHFTSNVTFDALNYSPKIHHKLILWIILNSQYLFILILVSNNLTPT